MQMKTPDHPRMTGPRFAPAGLLAIVIMAAAFLLPGLVQRASALHHASDSPPASCRNEV
jgi:hypothetical protein